MNFLRVAFFSLLVPFVLSACQSSQTASSSYGGALLGKGTLKSISAQRISGSFSSQMRFEESSYVQMSRNTESAERAAAKRLATKKKPQRASKKAGKAKTKKLTRKAISRSTVAKKLRRIAASKTSKATKARRVAKLSKKSRRGNRGNRARYKALIRKYARANGVPVRLAMAVVQVESNYRSNARGRAGEIGLMQIMPRTARGIGYRGKLRNLYNPSTNLRYGMKYLGKAYRLGGGTTCGAILKYNAGHGAKRMNPISRRYCKRVRRILRNT